MLSLSSIFVSATVFHTTFHHSLLMINIILSAQHFLNTIPTHISLRRFPSLCLNIQRLERYAILFKVGKTLTGCLVWSSPDMLRFSTNLVIEFCHGIKLTMKQ